MAKQTYDALIIGAGIMGCSSAFELATRGLSVAVVEKSGIGSGSTGKSSAIIRQHYSNEATARMALYSLRVFERFREVVGGEAGFRRTGFVVLTPEKDLRGLQANVRLQRELGIRTELLGAAEVRHRWPYLEIGDLVAAAYEEESGYADPNLTVHSYAEAAKARGATFHLDTQVTDVRLTSGKIQGVGTTRGAFHAPVVINCAGPYADQVGALAGVEIPSKPYRRQVLVTDPLPILPDVFPLIVDLDTGFYVHRQGKSAVLMGGTDKDIKPGLDTSVDWEAFGAVFQAAAKRVPPLAEAKVMRAYAGVRDLTPDYHGILGPARTAPGFHVACGFSGHGFMHAPAIGLLMAEIVLDGRTSSMDIDALSLDRFGAGTTRAEANMF